MKHLLAFVSAAMLVAVAVEAQAPPKLEVVQTRLPLEAKTLKGAPYSAEVVIDHTQVLADGNRIVEHTVGRVYRDSEGRVRREEDRPTGSPMISIVDPVAGVSYTLDPERRIAWKTPAQASITIMDKLDAAKLLDATVERAKVEALRKDVRARAAEGDKVEGPMVGVSVTGGRVEIRRGAGREAQHTEEGLAPRVMEGVRVEGRRTTTTIAAGAIGNDWPITTVSEEWTSPDLQVLVLTDHRDPRKGDSSYRLQRIVRGEPAATLFQVPSDYEIRETGIRRFELQRDQQ